MKKTARFSLALLLSVTSMILTPATAEAWIETQILRGHTSGVHSVAFKDNSTLISGSYDDYLRAWNLATGTQRWSKDVGNIVYAVAVPLHDPFYVAYGGANNGDVRLRYTDDGDWRGRLEGHTNAIRTLAFAPSRHLLASGSPDDTIRLWDTADVDNLRHLRVLRGHTSDVVSVAFSPDGRTLASGSADGTIRLWNPNNGINFAILRGHTEVVIPVAFSPDGRTLASGSADDTIRLWDIDTERTLRVLRGHTSNVYSVAFSPDGRTLASGSAGDPTIRLWNPNTGQHTATLRGHTKSVYSVAFSPDGRTLASGGDDTIRLWKPLSLDVTGNGSVNLNDLAEVAKNYGKTGNAINNRRADVNGDGRVDIEDLTLVAKAIDPAFAAPAAAQPMPLPFTVTHVQQWIRDAERTGLTADRIAALERLLTAISQQANPPKETRLLANYPNPFNPETWIPYQLAQSAEVTVSIHTADGTLVRTLELGQMPIGVYQDKDRAAYWDGTNAQGESVASGLYFYTLTAGDFAATGKMLIRK